MLKPTNSKEPHSWCPQVTRSPEMVQIQWSWTLSGQRRCLAQETGNQGAVWGEGDKIVKVNLRQRVSNFSMHKNHLGKWPEILCVRARAQRVQVRMCGAWWGLKSASKETPRAWMQVVHAKHSEKLLPCVAKESRWALIRQWGEALFPLTLKTWDY